MKGDRAIVVCSICLAAVYFYAIEQIPVRDIGDPVGPKAIPRLLGGLLLLTVGLLLLEMRLAGKKAPVTDQATAAGGSRDAWVVSGVVVLTLLYFAVFEWLGYALATTIYLTILMGFFNRPHWNINVLTATLFSFGSYLLFTKLFGAQLAQGVLPF